ncbi:MAG: hypothetical protein M0Q02_04940, partial [Candidatus Muirbacterium halophilum]|nr:hypothetical protein [Candidatus Muirbacterium halophilum]
LHFFLKNLRTMIKIEKEKNNNIFKIGFIFSLLSFIIDSGKNGLFLIIFPYMFCLIQIFVTIPYIMFLYFKEIYFKDIDKELKILKNNWEENYISKKLVSVSIFIITIIILISLMSFSSKYLFNEIYLVFESTVNLY